MNLSYFISKRINRSTKTGFSGTIHKIAVASITIGLAAAIVSFLVMKGFQDTVKNKIYGFSGHLIITKFSMNNSPEERPMNYHIDVYDNVKNYPFVRHIQEYAHKPGLVKTDEEVLGVVVKGVGQSFDTAAFQENMVAGRFISLPDSGYANEVVLSQIIADKLNASVGDAVVVHFFQNPPRSRKLKVTGIYETNLSEYFDSKVIISDIRLIQRLNDWSDSIAGGIEVFLDFNNAVPETNEITATLDEQGRMVSRAGGVFGMNESGDQVDQSLMRIGEMMDYDLNIQPVRERFIQVFEWLQLLSRQVNILLVIILTVICVNMISIILILVMERTQMIGLLKALGAGNRTIRSVFVFNGMQLISKGLLFGNLVGLGLCSIQDRFEIVKLNAHDYYMSVVPVSWNWEVVLMLNVLTFLVVTLVLLLPTMIIASINPIKAIRFD